MKKLAFLMSVAAFLSTSLNARVLVLHSQSTTHPGCPDSDWTLLWNGFSFMGSYWDGGRRAPQDLSSAGSCMRTFTPQPLIECRLDWCDYQSGGDWSQWFVTERYGDEGGTSMSGYPDTIPQSRFNEALSRVSRCSVCEINKPIIVKHSMSQTTPSCPNRWRSLWTGYSYGMGGRSSNYETYQDMSDTGSCQKLFVPNNVYPCYLGSCNFNNDKAMWYLSRETTSDRSSDSYSGPPPQSIKDRIGRCVVCIKE